MAKYIGAATPDSRGRRALVVNDGRRDVISSRPRTGGLYFPESRDCSDGRCGVQLAPAAVGGEAQTAEADQRRRPGRRLRDRHHRDAVKQRERGTLGEIGVPIARKDKTSLVASAVK